MPDLLTTALDHAARGWHVFPLRPDDRPGDPDHAKRPAFPARCTAEHCDRTDPRCRAAGRHVGWEERATTDPARITRAWSHRPYGIGIACGPSGLLVVDLDVSKVPGGPDGIDTFGMLAERHDDPAVWETYTVKTGRGGLHLYYRHPAAGPRLRNTQGDRGGLGPAVDTRSHGGYVVAAGTTVAGRPYAVDGDTDPAPLPGWLAGLLAPAPLPPQRPVLATIGTGRQAAYVTAAIDRETTRVAWSTPGERNHVLYTASVALGQLVAGRALGEDDATSALTAAAGRAGLDTTETARTIRSGLRAGAKRPRTVAA
ncbi:bifunctional DNA primase/polymerase [Plantactinospora sp. WMMB782]|uniref:bifunctional DNA primase/polymerase n=1 Tax=Plantactinospora sp. WMMB782 TaxID=3404121 RepID=UPI003B92532E